MKRILAAFTLWAIFTFWSIGVAFGDTDASGDPTGFTSALNTARAERGLPLVAFDPGLVPTAQRNNALQRMAGLGHRFTAGLAQCVACGRSDVVDTLNQWISSPPHRVLIFSPSAIYVGYKNDGYYATVAITMGTPAPTGVSLARVGDLNGTGRQPAAQDKNRPASITQQTTTPAAPPESLSPVMDCRRNDCGTGATAAGCGVNQCVTTCRPGGWAVNPSVPGRWVAVRGFHPFRSLFSRKCR